MAVRIANRNIYEQGRQEQIRRLQGGGDVGTLRFTPGNETVTPFITTTPTNTTPTTGFKVPGVSYTTDAEGNLIPQLQFGNRFINVADFQKAIWKNVFPPYSSSSNPYGYSNPYRTSPYQRYSIPWSSLYGGGYTSPYGGGTTTSGRQPSTAELQQGTQGQRAGGGIYSSFGPIWRSALAKLYQGNPMQLWGRLYNARQQDPYMFTQYPSSGYRYGSSNPYGSYASPYGGGSSPYGGGNLGPNPGNTSLDIRNNIMALNRGGYGGGYSTPLGWKIPGYL